MLGRDPVVPDGGVLVEDQTPEAALGQGPDGVPGQGVERRNARQVCRKQ